MRRVLVDEEILALAATYGSQNGIKASMAATLRTLVDENRRLQERIRFLEGKVLEQEIRGRSARSEAAERP